MDDVTLTSLVATAVIIGLVHTLAGPDHYLPFVAMSRAGRWSLRKTLAVTLACGLGHVLGSVVLGAIGLAVGAALGRLEWIEAIRGDLAAWLMLGFGLAYTAWGIRRALRNRPHVHWHAHADGTVHEHRHAHHAEHAHVHEAESRTLTPWILFTIFVLGPCEPLIPLLMAPAAKSSWLGIGMVVTAFSIATLAAMCVAVMVGHLGLSRIGLTRAERYGHALAGTAITACGLAMMAGL